MPNLPKLYSCSFIHLFFFSLFNSAISFAMFDISNLQRFISKSEFFLYSCKSLIISSFSFFVNFKLDISLSFNSNIIFWSFILFINCSIDILYSWLFWLFFSFELPSFISILLLLVLYLSPELFLCVDKLLLVLLKWFELLLLLEIKVVG